MKQEAFLLLREAEQSWWYKGRSLVVRAILARARISHASSILDYGAGFGGMHAELARISRQVNAFEPNAEARAVVATLGYSATYSTSSDALSKQYDLIGFFDVIEHIEDDKNFLLSLRKSLTIDGRIVITVPAFPFLWSKHDVDHQHFRRYTKSSLQKLLSDSGYDVVAISYWNMFFFIPAVIVRLLGKTGSSALTTSAPINKILVGIISLEAKILRLFALPFGVSLVAVVRKL